MLTDRGLEGVTVTVGGGEDGVFLRPANHSVNFTEPSVRAGGIFTFFDTSCDSLLARCLLAMGSRCTPSGKWLSFRGLGSRLGKEINSRLGNLSNGCISRNLER